MWILPGSEPVVGQLWWFPKNHHSHRPLSLASCWHTCRTLEVVGRWSYRRDYEGGAMEAC